MAEQNVARMRVRVTHPGYRGGERHDARDAFWYPLIREIEPIRPDRDIPPVDLIEARLRQNLGRHLHNALIAYFSGADMRRLAEHASVQAAHEERPARTGLLPQHAALLPLVSFQLRQIEYGSLDLALEIAGIQQLAKLFDGNFDVFMMFMEGYLPVAFEETLAPFHIDTEFLLFEAVPSQAVFADFASASRPSVAARMRDKAESMRLLVNGTLVIPVLLALAVLYVAAKNVAQERGELAALRKELSVRELTLAKSAIERAAQLERAQLEMIRLLTQDEPVPEEKTGPDEKPGQ